MTLVQPELSCPPSLDYRFGTINNRNSTKKGLLASRLGRLPRDVDIGGGDFGFLSAEVGAEEDLGLGVF